MNVIAEAAVPVPREHVRWAHAGLVWTLVRTDFKTRYHGTLAGFFWALLKPLIMFVALMSVFSYAFASTPNYKLDLIIGLFLWDFFAEGTKVGLTSLHAKGYLSIGCEPCTRALQPGEPERAGRWWWETDNARECGLHVGAEGKLVRSAAA